MSMKWSCWDHLPSIKFFPRHRLSSRLNTILWKWKCIITNVHLKIVRAILRIQVFGWKWIILKTDLSGRFLTQNFPTFWLSFTSLKTIQSLPRFFFVGEKWVTGYKRISSENVNIKFLDQNISSHSFSLKSLEQFPTFSR